jgi:two-component system, cell cycle response regulator DivK
VGEAKSDRPSLRATRGSSHAPPVLRVLLVDDDAEQRESVLLLLKETGCHIDVATDGAAAIRHVLKPARPDVILMDLTMPIMDGWEAIRRIRQAVTDHRSHIVAFSALPDADARRRAFEAGCDEYVVKPFDVRSVLRAYVERSRHRMIAR